MKKHLPLEQNIRLILTQFSFNREWGEIPTSFISTSRPGGRRHSAQKTSRKFVHFDILTFATLCYIIVLQNKYERGYPNGRTLLNY